MINDETKSYFERKEEKKRKEILNETRGAVAFKLTYTEKSR